MPISESQLASASWAAAAAAKTALWQWLDVATPRSSQTEEMVKHRGMVSDPNERYFELRRGAAAAPFVDQWFTTSVSGPSACSMAPDSRCIDEEGRPLWKCEWKKCEGTRLQPTGTWIRNSVTRHVHKFNFALSLPFCGPPTPMGLYC